MENKTGKYLKYAIGEIVLVVIGILIALQINTWNEQRKDRATEKELLEAIRTDFTETHSRLSATIELQTKVVSYSRRLLILREQDRLLEKKDSIADFVIYGALSWWRAEPVTGTYDAMVSTGNIGLIRNKALRGYLAEFDAELRSGFEDHEHSMDLLMALTTEQSAFPFILTKNKFRKEQGLSDTKSAEEQGRLQLEYIHELQKNQRFFGFLASKLVMELNRLDQQEKMMLFVNQVLERIEAELRPLY